MLPLGFCVASALNEISIKGLTVLKGMHVTFHRFRVLDQDRLLLRAERFITVFRLCVVWITVCYHHIKLWLSILKNTNLAILLAVSNWV